MAHLKLPVSGSKEKNVTEEIREYLNESKYLYQNLEDAVKITDIYSHNVCILNMSNQYPNFLA